jgi:lipocalin-like protein
MNRRYMLAVTSLFALFLGLALLAADAVGQQKPLKEQLVGAWTLVSASSGMWGSDPKSLLIFTDNGRYSLSIMRSDRAKFASNNRALGTPEENKATVQGTSTHFGAYSVNEADRTITFHVESASFPNWNGSDQKRPVTLAGDELRYTTPAPSGGSSPDQLVWRRIK